MTQTTGRTPLPTWIVAHDFSDCADAAADLAVSDLGGSQTGGRVVLLHVISLTHPMMMDAAVPLDIVGLERSLREDASARLHDVAGRLAQRPLVSPPIQIECVTRMGTPAEAILEECDAQKAERIVIGTHGRRAVSHLLLGSVAERVVRRAQVPVLVAHAPRK